MIVPLSTIITYLPILIVLVVVVPFLVTVAFVTIGERKTMASMQRRLGPNAVGYFGLMQAFADALKLLLKEYVSPAQANLVIFFIGPVITLIYSLLGIIVIPFGLGLVIANFKLGILYLLAVSSLSTYGILLAGWSANSKYAFLGSLRSTAQLVSYELVLSSGIVVVIMLTGSLNITDIIEAQRSVWFIVPLFPLFIILFIGSVAETNRAPFDLAEAESELVSGFMTEHAAVVFVFFFLAEYASIVLICMLNTILFLGGYLFNFDIFAWLYYIQDLYDFFVYGLNYDEKFLDPNLLNLIGSSLGIDLSINAENAGFLLNPSESQRGERFEDYWIPLGGETLKSMFPALILGIKTCLMIFVFIWVRASFPRIRYDQLMSFCWTVLLPIIIAHIILVPCILYSFEIIPANIPVL